MCEVSLIKNYKITGAIYFVPSGIIHSSWERYRCLRYSSRIQKRDEHLRNSDLFDMSKYPKITFKSTKVEVAGGNYFKVTG
jgi:hypothetical protein